MDISSKSSAPRTAVFTIVSKNYLHYARVLMRSLEAADPSSARFVLLADRLDGAFHPELEHFTVVQAEELPLPDAKRFIFRYTILEFNTAVKPWFFRRLFEDGYDHVVYLDPDIYVYAPLQEVDQILAAGALAVLVPHLTGRLLDDAHPGEHDILQAGAYNLGFCALARHPRLADLLDFWCDKSVREFVVELQRGLFTDQRWMDLVPGMFPDVHILRHEGYDVAYWNLPHRHSVAEHGTISINGQALVFFHFSGIDPMNPAAFSRHQDRYALSTSGAIAGLFSDYCSRLHDADSAICRKWPYAYGYLEDGSPIPDVLRKLYRSTPEVEEWAGANPYARSVADWNRPVDALFPPVSRVMLAVYQARPDIRLTWPQVLGVDRAGYAQWFVENAQLHETIPRCYVEPIRVALASRPVRASDSRVSRQTSRVSFNTELVTGALRKAAVAVKERRLPISPRRWLQLYKLHTLEQSQEIAVRSPQLPPISWPGRRRHQAAASAETGLTVVGYVSDGTGIAAGAQSSMTACAAVGVAAELLDARPLGPIRGRYGTTLLHVNADQLPSVAGMLGDEFFRDRYIIGAWAWELPQFPDAYLEAFRWVHEVWAGSRFIQGAVSHKSQVPVLHMPYAVTVAPTAGAGRARFQLPANRFLFLTMYDALSVQDRKNPLGAIAAFRKAFGSSQDVGMVVRVNHASSRSSDVALVRQQVAETAGTCLIDAAMSREDAQALQACCDAFVSLHRAEGFGLNIAEAMLLQKPVIATSWSGNMDFTTHRNACLVDYHLAKLTTSSGPYEGGNEWAEPDVEHAAQWMKRLVNDPVFRAEIGRRGQATIATDFSPAAVGQMYRRRMEWIDRHHQATLASRSCSERVGS